MLRAVIADILGIVNITDIADVADIVTDITDIATDNVVHEQVGHPSMWATPSKSRRTRRAI